MDPATTRLLDWPSRFAESQVAGIHGSDCRSNPPGETRRHPLGDLFDRAEPNGHDLGVGQREALALVSGQHPAVPHEGHALRHRSFGRDVVDDQQPAERPIESQLLGDLSARGAPGRLVRVDRAAGDVPLGLVARLDQEDPPLLVPVHHPCGYPFAGQASGVLIEGQQLHGDEATDRAPFTASEAGLALATGSARLRELCFRASNIATLRRSPRPHPGDRDRPRSAVLSAPAATSRLRELRLERGWTQQEVAERLARIAWARREAAGVTGDMIAKWERGARNPSAFYRKLYAALFQVPADQLGLPSTARGASAVRRMPEDRAVSVIDEAVDLLAQLGDPGQAIRPGVLAALDTEPATHGPLSPAELDDLAGRYENAHATAPPAALMTALRTHLRMVAEALRNHPAAGTRQRLMLNRARVAILAGRIAAEDTGEVMAARGYYAQAIDNARETGDHTVAVIAYGYAAQLATDQGQHTAALEHLDTAAKLNPGGPALTAWLAATEATAHAATGNQPAAWAALDRAHAAVDEAAGTPAVRWFTDASTAQLRAHLTATTGRVLLAAGDHNAARDRLTDAATQLAGLGPDGRRALLTCQLDLADTERAAGQFVAAIRMVAQAAQLHELSQRAVAAVRLRCSRDILHTGLDAMDTTPEELADLRQVLASLHADVA